MRNDFYRYLSWRIQCVPSERKLVQRHKNYYISSFTNGSWILIENFVDYTVEVFNNSHSVAQKLSTDSTIKMLEEWWDYDYEDYLWDNVGEEGGEKEKHGETGPEICLIDNDREMQNQTHDDGFSNFAKKVVLYENNQN